MKGHVDVLQILLNYSLGHAGLLTAVDGYSRTAMHWAVIKERKEAVDLLKTQGVKLDIAQMTHRVSPGEKMEVSAEVHRLLALHGMGHVDAEETKLKLLGPPLHPVK